MSSPKGPLILIVIGSFLIGLIFDTLYILQEGEQAVITQLGRLVYAQDQAGLHAKIPIFQKLHLYPAKILRWDGDAQRIPTGGNEKQFIWIDTTARWKIVDPSRFYTTVQKLNQAYQRLDETVDPAVRSVIARYPLIEVIRTSNRIMENPETETLGMEDLQSSLILTDEGSPEESLDSALNGHQDVTKGRTMLSQEILDQARRGLEENFGILLLDVIIRHVRYDESLLQSIQDRMIAERRQVAQFHRGQGAGTKQEWEGKLEKDLNTLLSQAYAESERIRGEADAEAARIYSQAYSADPNFYSFWRALESYRKTLPETDKTLSTDMEYFNQLYRAN